MDYSNGIELILYSTLIACIISVVFYEVGMSNMKRKERVEQEYKLTMRNWKL